MVKKFPGRGLGNSEIFVVTYIDKYIVLLDCIFIRLKILDWLIMSVNVVECDCCGIGVDPCAGLTGGTGGTGYAGCTGVYIPGGVQGPLGVQGKAGVGGSQGYPGINGFQGSQGDTGWIGRRGPDGYIAANRRGETGVQGAQGAQGPPGLIGRIGDSGFVGYQGPQGSQGGRGPQGVAGPDGVASPDGYVGSIGDRGLQGGTGANGGSLNAFFYAETASTLGGPPETRLQVGNGDELRIFSDGGIDISLVAGSALYTLEPANIVSVSGIPTNPPADRSRPILWMNTLDGALYLWDPNLSGGKWEQKTSGGGAGAQGDQGNRGVQGAQGARGSQGIAISGDTGPSGEDLRGVQGNPGSNVLGTQGEPGEDLIGKTGAPGRTVMSDLFSTPHIVHTIDSGDPGSFSLPVNYMTPGAVIEVYNLAPPGSMLVLPTSAQIISFNSLLPGYGFFWHIFAGTVTNTFRCKITGETIFYSPKHSVASPVADYFPPYQITSETWVTILFMNYGGVLRGLVWDVLTGPPHTYTSP